MKTEMFKRNVYDQVRNYVAFVGEHDYLILNVSAHTLRLKKILTMSHAYSTWDDN